MNIENEMNRTGRTLTIDTHTCHAANASTGGMPGFERPTPLYKCTPIHNHVLTILIIFSLFFLTSCHKKVVQVFPDEGEVVREPVPAVVERVRDSAGGMVEVKRVAPLVERVVVNPVYFDFDKAEIRGSELKELGRWLGVIGKGRAVELVGHCDERGGEEYNIELGMKRAESVRGWLKSVNRGIKDIRCYSYGEGKLVREGCGRDEGCHEKNRRVEMRVVE